MYSRVLDMRKVQRSIPAVRRPIRRNGNLLLRGLVLTLSDLRVHDVPPPELDRWTSVMAWKKESFVSWVKLLEKFVENLFTCNVFLLEKFCTGNCVFVLGNDYLNKLHIRRINSLKSNTIHQQKTVSIITKKGITYYITIRDYLIKKTWLNNRMYKENILY